jgi:hypothetical protein
MKHEGAPSGQVTIATIDEWRITSWYWKNASYGATRDQRGERGRADVTLMGDLICVEWVDTADDLRGTTTRMIYIPLAVLRWVVNQGVLPIQATPNGPSDPAEENECNECGRPLAHSEADVCPDCDWRRDDFEP